MTYFREVGAALCTAVFGAIFTTRLSLFLKHIPLSDVAGLVARGEAIGGEKAEALEPQRRDAPEAADARELELATTGAIRTGGSTDSPLAG